MLDVEAYYEGCPVERIPPASAQRVGTAVGHFTDPEDVRAASTEARRLPC